MNMEWLKLYLFALVGTPYRWGGDDTILGFDCSGLACEVLIAMGVLPHGTDMTAQALFDHFSKQGSVESYGIGALAFYGKDVKHITHVAVSLDETLMVEAGGGGADTVSLDAAARRNAFCRVRAIKYRKDFLCVVKPYYLKGKA